MWVRELLLDLVASQSAMHTSLGSLADATLQSSLRTDNKVIDGISEDLERVTVRKPVISLVSDYLIDAVATDVFNACK